MQVTEYLPVKNILEYQLDSENGMRVENTFQSYSNQNRIFKNLEKVFLEQMAGHIMPDASGGTFSGGIGETQFASFLEREYAAALSAQLDLGLKVHADG